MIDIGRRCKKMNSQSYCRRCWPRLQRNFLVPQLQPQLLSLMPSNPWENSPLLPQTDTAVSRHLTRIREQKREVYKANDPINQCLIEPYTHGCHQRSLRRLTCTCFMKENSKLGVSSDVPCRCYETATLDIYWCSSRDEHCRVQASHTVTSMSGFHYYSYSKRHTGWSITLNCFPV